MTTREIDHVILVCRDGREAECAIRRTADGYAIAYPEGLGAEVLVPDLDEATINAAFAPDWEEQA